MEQTYNIRLTLGGIGMLIYGMVLMEEVIKKLVKSSLQEKLEHYTKNKWNSFLLGIGATALTQSSSLISLLLLVFVGAGIIALPSAIAVIIGSNIGTTFSSMIIALLGFGKFSITAFAFPLIAIGGLGLLFFKDKKWRYYLKLLLSFGLLFFGIDLIKDSVEMLKTVIDFTQYAKFGVIGFFLLGVIMTAVIQSSHTVVIMTLAALHGGIITFPMALGIVIGSNIGTTITVIFASLGGSRAKKNVAYAHLGFNCILSIIGLLYYPGITWIVTEGMGLQDNPIIALAVFNTVLNAITACVVLPFLGQFVNYVTSYTKKQQENTVPLHCERIQGSESLTESFPIITLRALHLDSKKILVDSCRYTLQLFDRDIVTKEVVLTKKPKNIKSTLLNKLKNWFSPSNELLQTILPTEESIEERTYNQQLHRKFYDETKQSIEVVLPTLLQLEQQELSEHEHHKQEALEGVINNSIEVMKYGKAIWEDIEKLRNAKGGLQDYYKDRQEHIENLCKKIVSTINNKELSVEEFREMFGIEKSLYKLQRSNSKKFLETISQKTAGTIPLSTLFNIERHILYIEKFLIKSWKAWGKGQTGHESGFTTFVHDLYDDGLLVNNDTSSNE